MRFIAGCGFAIAVLSLASCADVESAFAEAFHANLTPSSPSPAHGVTSALIFQEQLVVSGTFSGLSSAAKGAAIMDGDEIVATLIIVQQDATNSGAFERFFDAAGHESALKDARYQVRVMTALNTAGELRGTLVPTGLRPFSFALDGRRLEERFELAR